jgi:hypothetical protein
VCVCVCKCLYKNSISLFPFTGWESLFLVCYFYLHVLTVPLWPQTRVKMNHHTFRVSMLRKTSSRKWWRNWYLPCCLRTPSASPSSCPVTKDSSQLSMSWTDCKNGEHHLQAQMTCHLLAVSWNTLLSHGPASLY